MRTPSRRRPFALFALAAVLLVGLAGPAHAHDGDAYPDDGDHCYSSRDWECERDADGDRDKATTTTQAPTTTTTTTTAAAPAPAPAATTGSATAPRPDTSAARAAVTTAPPSTTTTTAAHATTTPPTTKATPAGKGSSTETALAAASLDPDRSPDDGARRPTPVTVALIALVAAALTLVASDQLRKRRSQY